MYKGKLILCFTFFREIAFGGMVIGFFIKLVLRIAFFTLNPLWTSAATNIAIFAFGLVSVIDRSMFISEIEAEHGHLENEKKPVPFSSWIVIALGIGAWFFMAQWLFGEVSVISRYTGTGFPSLSILPVPGG